jgi:hypothetical protein
MTALLLVAAGKEGWCWRGRRWACFGLAPSLGASLGWWVHQQWQMPMPAQNQSCVCVCVCMWDSSSIGRVARWDGWGPVAARAAPLVWHLPPSNKQTHDSSHWRGRF